MKIKAYYNVLLHEDFRGRVLIKTMSLIFILLFTLSQLCVASLSSLQSVQIMIKEKNVSLIQLFNKIEKVSNFLFFYVDADVRNIKVSVDVKNATIQEVLNITLKGTQLTYQLKGVMSIYCL